MKPVRLELQGFTAFREKAVVEFEGRRLFAITGPTGAGKSSLLDAITWALYGEVARVGKATQQLVSHHAPAMSVLFEFCSRGRRYRVSRRAPGAAAVRLERREDDGDWTPLAERARDVTAEVTRILGLDYKTFTKTILLPQGAFDSFLKGELRERREILGRLLGLEVYGQARALAGARAQRARDRAETLRGQLGRLELASPEAIAGLETRRAELEAAASALEARRGALATLAELARTERTAGEEARKALEAAEAAARAVAEAERRLAEAQQALDAAAKRAEALTAELDALGYDREAHEQLRTRVALLEMRERDRQALERARKTLAEAEQAERDAAAAAAKATREAKRAATHAERAEQERAQAAAALTSAAGRAYRAINRLSSEVMSAEEERQKSEREAAEHEHRARQLDSLRQRLEALESERVAAEAAHAESVRGVEAAEGAASLALARRERAAQALGVERERFEALRAEHAAAVLTRALRPGDPCPVCGKPVESVEPHEAPDLDAAEAAVRAAECVLDEARAEAERGSAQAAGARAQAEAAARALEALGRQRGALEAEAALAGAESGAVAAAIAAARREVESARGRAEAARARGAARREAEQGLKVALAAVPREVPVSGEEYVGEADELSADPLQAALGSYTSAAEASRAAAETQKEAATRAAMAEREAAQAKRTREQASAAVEEAEHRLAEHQVQDDADPAALRGALAQADEHARRARELEAASQEARTAVAAASASREGHEAEATRTREDAAQRAEQREQAATAAREATSQFAAAWSATIGEGAPAYDELKQVMDGHVVEEQATTRELGVVTERLEQARRAAADAEQIREEAAGLEREGQLAAALERELRSDRFIAYVQREAMVLLAGDASERLAAFTGGRYELAADEDEFKVIDRLNGDERRSVKTLSGGETFLASLALALALSEHLPSLSGAGAAVSLESLFLDEGFGALDAESLDLAVQGLETLAGGERMIGVISHVPELAERLPERIEVVRNGNSSSVRA